MSRIIPIALLCCFVFCLSVLAAGPISIGLNQIKQSDSDLSSYVTNAPAKDLNNISSIEQENAAVLEQDSGTSLVEMNDGLLGNASINNTATSQVATEGNITTLMQDSGTNLTEMNIMPAISPTYSTAQAVKFTAPKSGWDLKYISVMATDGWNASSNELPKPLPFAIEVRDANLTLLYHHEGTQLPYFTSRWIRMAVIDVPVIPLSGDFFVCFYGYGLIYLAAEVENATGNSYYFDSRTGILHDVELTMSNNQTTPVNWIIRATGE